MDNAESKPLHPLDAIIWCATCAAVVFAWWASTAPLPELEKYMPSMAVIEESDRVYRIIAEPKAEVPKQNFREVSQGIMKQKRHKPRKAREPNKILEGMNWIAGAIRHCKPDDEEACTNKILLNIAQGGIMIDEAP